MSAQPTDFEGTPSVTEIYRILSAADPSERSQQILGLLERHPGGRLELPAKEGLRAMLDGIDLSREFLKTQLERTGRYPAWWDAERQAIDLRRANLRGASLRHANLEAAILEEANLAEADLAGANLQGTNLAGANLRGTLLEDANLRKASLRFAHGQGAVLEEAKLQGADLWGADMEGADLSGADLQGATLEEAKFAKSDLAGVDLRGANLKRANFRGASLRGADLRAAGLGGTNLDEAVLRDAKVQDLELLNCTLAHVHTCGAHLEKTRLDREQLRGAIGEEMSGEFELARKGYLVLERNFGDLGDHDAARWAYQRRRRMEKREAGTKARTAWIQGRWRAATRFSLKYAGDLFVEYVCDYGESVWRVLGTLLVIYVLFIPIYGLTGTVMRVEKLSGGEVRALTYALSDLPLFSMTAMTSPGNPPDYLIAANEAGYLLAGIQTLLTIFLTGLMGFVAGNRIRR